MGTSTVSKSKKSKAAKSALAIALALALAFSGTFAWTSFSQQARNEMKAFANPGGRLHDDFIWTSANKDKDIYVENFTDPDADGVSIYARVKLVEYLEIGDGAGENLGDTTAILPASLKQYPAGVDRNDPSTWATHMFENTHQTENTALDAAQDVFHKYFGLKFGGQSTYMPTFNKNKDSLDADMRGSLHDMDGADERPYFNYEKFSKGATELGYEYFDADNNTADEEKLAGVTTPGAGGTEDVNYTKSENQITHTVDNTLSSEVISMQTWKTEKNSEPGPYWVYDTDGWAYWAQAVLPGTATGLLLDNVKQASRIGENWYYAINAIGEFVTADEIKADDNVFGTKITETGGSATTEVRTTSADAQTLLAKAIAKAPFDEGIADIKRAPTAMKAEENGDATESIITLEGTQYIKLAQDGNKALLLTRDIVSEPPNADDAGNILSYGPSVLWEESNMRSWCNEKYYKTLSSYVQNSIDETRLITKPAYNATDETTFKETLDKVFLLTEADVYGQNEGVEAIEDSDAKYYTYGHTSLVPSSLRGSGWWLRSPRNGYIQMAIAAGPSTSTWGNHGDKVRTARPAFWINLES